MRTNEIFEEVVGQTSVKHLLSMYIEAYKETSRLPFYLFESQKGSGKSFLVRKFREGLRRKDGSRPPILEINCAAIKSTKSFFEQVVPVWTQNSAFMFLDEFQNFPKDLQAIFLSVLDVKSDPIRIVEFEGVHYEFDFRNICFAAASTDPQKLLKPLKDRLRSIALEEYKSDELFQIFEKNLENRVSIDEDVRQQIISTFRGNPRDAVVKAEDLKTYVAAQSSKTLGTIGWEQFCQTMGIKPLGLNSAEMQIIKTLGKNGDCSLNFLASVTGFEKSAIQNDYEALLFRKGLLSVDGKRRLSADGIRFYHQFCKS